jgi:hypothetical protein
MMIGVLDFPSNPTWVGIAVLGDSGSMCHAFHPTLPGSDSSVLVMTSLCTLQMTLKTIDEAYS